MIMEPRNPQVVQARGSISSERRVMTNATADESGQVMSDLQVIIPRRFDIDLKPVEIPEDILVGTYS
jgi:hypothetical protein